MFWFYGFFSCLCFPLPASCSDRSLPLPPQFPFSSFFLGIDAHQNCTCTVCRRIFFSFSSIPTRFSRLNVGLCLFPHFGSPFILNFLQLSFFSCLLLLLLPELSCICYHLILLDLIKDQNFFWLELFCEDVFMRNNRSSGKFCVDISKMMKCFYIFKSSKSQQGRSAPELRNKSSTSDNSSASRPTRSTGSVSLPRSIPEMYREKEHNLIVFSSSELREATNNFNKLLKLGEGGFGSVYKGKIRPPDGQGDPLVVAIKRLNTSGMQGHKEWVSEVQFLGVLDHPNLVKLWGYCAEDGERGIQRLLVYEYMPNKSLEDHLFNRSVPAIPWRTRLNVILGAAEGMAYLHHGLEVQVIYRDFKSSNILLDKEFNPKISDFGLAREGPLGDRSHVSTAPVGTFGYAAPEYVQEGHLSTKSDLYSFGVVLYEILTGRRALERNLPPAERKLLEWVKQFPADTRKFSMIIDPRLRNQYSLKAATSIAKLADSCLNKNAKDRPTISQVVEVLKQAIQDSEEEGSSNVTGPEFSTSYLVTLNRHMGARGIPATRRRSHAAQA